MSFDPARLRHWQVPDVRQSLTRRDTALYALSTGYGADPLDADALRFVDPAAPAMVASPSMALVLGYPGFWIADPALGVDAPKVLHVDQSIAFDAPLPVEGEVIGVTGDLALIDRGEGRGALLRSTRAILHAGRRIALLTQTLLLRSEGGFAETIGPRPARRVVPEGEPDLIVPFDLPPGAALLYRLNGDLNPVHADPAVAARGGFARPIMHGMGTFGFACRLIVGAACGGDPTRLRGIGMRFTAPAYPGDALRLEMWRAGAFRVAREDGATICDDGWFEAA